MSVDNHPLTLGTRHHLVRTVADQVAGPRPRPDGGELLDAERRVLGAHHALTLATRRHPASVIGSAGRAEGALALEEVVDASGAH